MRAVENSLDLNSLPEDRSGKQPLEESSMTTAASVDINTRFSNKNNKTNKKKKKKKKKRKSGGKDDSAKVYECRFCSLKFYKSQALGGHMNRHRQERESETLHRARQLVFGKEACAFGLRDQAAFQYAAYPRSPRLYPSSSSHLSVLAPLSNSYINGHAIRGAAFQVQHHYSSSYGPAAASFTCYGSPLSRWGS